MGMDAHGFEATYKALLGEYQMLGLTILDHGDSDTPEPSLTLPAHAEIMRDCYRQIGFDPNFLVGHSVGGMMGMILAAEHPEELKGLVLVDIAPRVEERKYTRAPPPDHFADEEVARTYFRERYPGFTEDSIENRMKHGIKMDDEGRFSLKSRPDVMRPSLAHDLWPYVERITIPTLIIKGSESAAVSQIAEDRMKGLIPGFEVVSVEGAAHMVPQDRPEEFEVHLRRFLGRFA
jgi:pimeloyl-ACP methyl ester carboxylesterase